MYFNTIFKKRKKLHFGSYKQNLLDILYDIYIQIITYIYNNDIQGLSKNIHHMVIFFVRNFYNILITQKV